MRPEQGRTRRQFVAGAACPRCSRIDVLYLEDVNGKRVCACIECGEIDRMASDGAAPVHGLGEGLKAASVRIIDPAQTTRDF